MDLINGLKIESYDSLANVIKILRKYGDWSISNIKQRIERDLSQTHCPQGSN